MTKAMPLPRLILEATKLCETTIVWLPYYSSQPFDTYKTGLADRWDPLAFAAQEEEKNKTK